MRLFSIIVPVYNVKEYLKECVNSLIGQTYKTIEIILVDDGSTDGSGEICDRYLTMDTRIKVVHKKNGGLSSARNTGVALASGEYVLFVDSDDYISLDYLELVNQSLQEKEYDMVVAKIVHFVDGKIPERYLDDIDTMEFTQERALETIYYQEFFDVNAASKIMKTDIVKNNPFVEGILYEDFKNIHKFICGCADILYLSGPLYFYRQRINSIMNSSFDTEQLLMIDIAQEHIDFVEDKFPSIREAAIRRYVQSNFYMLGNTLQNMSFLSQSKILRKNILRYKKNILTNKRVETKEKIGVCLIFFGIRPFKFFWHIYVAIKRSKI